MNRKQKMRLKHIILILSILLLSRNSWRDIPRYFKSIGYVSSCNALYYLLCRRHLLWEFSPMGIKWGLIRFIHVVIITPLFVLTFLSKIPHSLIKQIIYTIKWVITACIIEYFVHKQKLIIYAHGWNIYWTGLIYTLMLTFSSLFSKRPYITLFLSLCSTVFFTIKFHVPMKFRHVSEKFERFVDIYYHSCLEDLVYKFKRLVQ